MVALAAVVVEAERVAPSYWGCSQSVSGIAAGSAGSNGHCYCATKGESGRTIQEVARMNEHALAIEYCLSQGEVESLLKRLEERCQK